MQPLWDEELAYLRGQLWAKKAGHHCLDTGFATRYHHLGRTYSRPGLLSLHGNHELLDDLNRKYGITIIFITHDMHLAIEYTDRALVFSDGELIADDSVFKVLSNDDVITKASLKQTSLYTLAKRLDLDPESYIEHFIAYEKDEKG